MNLSVSVRKNFGGFGLDVDFSTASKRVGIFGRSGSGKSTLVHMLAGLIEPDQGTIELDGDLLYCSAKKVCVPPEKRRIAVVFQQAHLFPHMSAGRNLFYGYRRTPARLRLIDPETLIRVLDLKELLHRNVGTLSGGERQRVALGRAVLANPRLLLMDEPLSALDEGLKYQIIPYLSAVFEQFDIPACLISHSMNEMRLMTDEVIVVHRGEISDQTTPDKLARKRMGWTRAGYVNLLKLQDPVEENGLYSYHWNGHRLLTSARGGRGAALFELSSKDIMLFREEPTALSARNLLKCRVVSVFGLEDRVGVELACGEERLMAQMMKRSAEELGIAKEMELHAIIKASAFRRLY